MVRPRDRRIERRGQYLRRVAERRPPAGGAGRDAARRPASQAGGARSEPAESRRGAQEPRPAPGGHPDGARRAGPTPPRARRRSGHRRVRDDAPQRTAAGDRGVGNPAPRQGARDGRPPGPPGARPGGLRPPAIREGSRDPPPARAARAHRSGLGGATGRLRSAPPGARAGGPRDRAHPGADRRAPARRVDARHPRPADPDRRRRPHAVAGREGQGRRGPAVADHQRSRRGRRPRRLLQGAGAAQGDGGRARDGPRAGPGPAQGDPRDDRPQPGPGVELRSRCRGRAAGPAGSAADARDLSRARHREQRVQGIQASPDRGQRRRGDRRHPARSLRLQGEAPPQRDRGPRSSPS